MKLTERRRPAGWPGGVLAAALCAFTLQAQSVREVIPTTAPVGARVLVTGSGLNDPNLAIAFGSTSATIVQHSDRFLEAIVPASGNVRITLSGTLLKELPFTVASEPRYLVSTLAEVFKHPNGAAVVLPDGTIAVADEQHHQIQLVTPAGVVSVLAGSGKNGSKDGKGAAAEFNAPRNVTFDPQARVLYVADSGNSNIRRVALDGTVTTIAGTGKKGYRDGIGSVAQFNDPHGLTIGANGAIYIADTKNNRIRKVLPDGTTTTFAGSGAKGNAPGDGSLLTATFNEPKGIVAAGSTLYVADTKNNAIRRLANGQVTTVIAFARTGDDDDPDDGVDGNPAVLKRPSGIGVDEAGNLIVADSENDFIRRIHLATTPATMTTIAGTGKNGQVDGDGAIAQFKDPIGLSVAGAIYVADEDNDALRRLCAEVRVTGFFSLTGAVTAGTEVRILGTGFVPGGTIVKLGSVIATDVTWISASELAVKLPATIATGSVTVTVSACGGTTAPATFIIDNTAPALTITNIAGSLFNVPVTPLIAAADDSDPAPRIIATLNGLPFVSGTTIAADGIYTLAAHAEDAAGNVGATQSVTFTIDTTRPIVEVLEHGAPFIAGAISNRPVEFELRITDLTPTTVVATIDGAPYTIQQPYAEPGTHAITIRVTDALGSDVTIGPLAFTIDITGPALTITSHTEGEIVTGRAVTIRGDSDDALSVQVNGANAVIDPATKTFTIALTLAEGENTLVVTGRDAASNPGSFTRRIVLDSLAPQLTIAAVASCTKSDTLELHGTVDDPHADGVVVKIDALVVDATVVDRTWSATVALGTEGRKAIRVEAGDSVGHTASEQVTFTFDRTAPVIDISESGAPFTATIFNRRVTPFFRVTDGDGQATLDGAAFTSGSEIASEGAHTLRITAGDCAGNEATRELAFTIDLTAPRFLSFAPASGAKLTEIPAALTGTVDADAIEVRVVDQGVTTPAAGGTFTLPDPGFVDGVNDLTLELLDRAGNISRTSYILGIRTTKPLLEIVEGGASLADGTVYTRAVKPELRVFESHVTATATLDSAPFVSGTEITIAGAHTLVATATDAAFAQTNTITRHFAIDRDGPQVAFVSPANGSALDVDRIDVRVTAGHAVRVVVNGIAAIPQADASWLASNVPLDFGETTLVAIAYDDAGNSGSASISITRGNAGPALVLTFPPDHYVTNRPRLDVTGRVLRAGSTVVVTVPPASAVSVATDPAGTFRLTGATLTEGETTIVATATEGGQPTSITARVIADFTPPHVRILESNAAFEDGAGFGTRAVITGEALDGDTPLDFMLTIDGSTVASPATITANGGHVAIVTARDVAGNETRVERNFTIGTSAAGGCALDAFDPPDQAIVTSQKVELVGRSGGAAGVKVNGIAAKLSNGSFCASVELPQEGPNSITIACTNADGTTQGDPKTITLVRVTNEPSVTISTPAEDSVTADATIIVSGTLGNGAVSVEVNGRAATISGTNWTLADVRLTDGVNVIVARARNNAGRSAVASRRITQLADAPAISISAPIPGFISGTSTTDLSGTFANVEPSSLALTGVAGAIEPTAWSDTTGKFIARNVPLQAGDNTLVVTGRDRTGRIARAEVAIRYLATSPVVTITSPTDGDYFGAAQGETFRVSGTFAAEEGSSVDVNGVTATVDASAKTWFADVPFSTLPGGMTPVVARLAQPSGGDGAFDSLRIYKLADAPRVLELFPAANAIEVDPGVVTLALFSAPMERTATVAAFRLESSNGTLINGKTLLDKDVLTFAPATTLTPGERYTIRIADTAKDLAGQALAAAIESSFIASTTAPAQAPTLTTASGRICEQLVDVTGTSSPGARIRLDYGAIFFTTTASATGAFSYKVPLSGQPGYHVIRVRTAGADGTLSAAAELKLNLDCTGPRVLRASFDRNVNTLTIVFSTDIDAASLTSNAIQLVLSDDRIVAATVSVSGANVIVTPSEDLTTSTFTLQVSRDVADLQGRKLESAHTQLFAVGEDDDVPPGSGFISGEVYDATTGRPLAGATIEIEVPTAAFSRGIRATSAVATQSIAMTTDARGRYAKSLPEGAHTIRASANNYTSAWRQIIVPAGAGVTPIDIRLTRRGATQTVNSGAEVLVHGGDDAVTRRAELAIPAGAVTSGASITLTSIGTQSLAGLLPLGWSPLASAEILSPATIAATLTFDVPQAAIEATTQSLSAVRYDEARDEWRVLVPVVNIASNRASFEIATPGAYALVYRDRRPGLTPVPDAIAGAPLVGIPDPCAGGTCPSMIARGFPLAPDVVLPTGTTVATLQIDGAVAHIFASGTAVQAYIDEELRLADGGRELPTPFATDLLLYRDLAGNEAIAAFHLAPSPRAAEVFLEVGFDHIRVLPYPGRLDRGTVIGPEGGRVPGDAKVTIEIPTGAMTDPLLATASSVNDLNALPPIAGYTILAAFDLTLARTSASDNTTPIELTRPARATFPILNSQFSILNSVLLVEQIEGAFRLAAEMTQREGTWTTKPIDRTVLPLDGIIREGRYLLLAANAPIAIARGVVRYATGVAANNARIATPTLGVIDRSRITGIFNIPVPAAPAAPFTLTPRATTIGDGATYTHPSSPAPATIVNVGDLTLLAQPPYVASTIPANNTTNVSLTTTVEANLAPGIDPSSVDANSLTVIDTTNGNRIAGTVAANGALGVRWTLPAGETLQQGRRYLAAIASNIRGTNGTPLGQPYTFSFTTAATVTSQQVHPERIRITIPDANGVSKIIGAPGAMSAGWVAVPVRRGRDFPTSVSAQAAVDESFTITLAGVSLDDTIDLRVLNNNGALAAILPLTPFVSEDGRAFIAPAKTAVTFTSIDGYSLEVPAGAFDLATRIDVAPTTPTAFNGVPRVAQELIFANSVDVRFTGRANAPLQLTLPVVVGTDLSRELFLAKLGQSTRGPRLMAVDTLTVIDGKLTTKPQQTSANARNFRTNAATTNAKDLLQKVIEAGTYAAAMLHPDHGTLAWSFLNTGASVMELTWDTLQSLYVDSHYVAESKGAVAFPVPAGTKFVVTATDPATALALFEETYNAIPVGAPGSGTDIAAPILDVNGPHPVFATPFRIETAIAPPAGITLTAIRDVEIELNEGITTVRGIGAFANAGLKVSILDVDTGERRGPGPLPMTLSTVKAGHQLVLAIEEKDIAQSSTVSVVFNEAIDVGNAATPAELDAFLRTIVDFDRIDAPGAAATDLLANASLRLDSSGRRITILLPSPLEAGVRFRLTLDASIRDRSGNQLRLGQAGQRNPDTNVITPIGPAPVPMELWFRTRGPHGTFAEFDIRQSETSQFGAVRELARYDNLLFVAAVDGGILAYDVSDPAALDNTKSPQPIAVAPGRDNQTSNAVTDYWSVDVDHHGRVFATGLANMFGALRTWRVEDFINAKNNTADGCLPTIKSTVCQQTGGAIVSQTPGSAYGVGLASAVVADDRVEAIPRKAKFVIGDAEPVTYDWSTFVAGFCNGNATDAGDGIHQKCDAEVPSSGSNYRIQRITIENATLGLRWSEDAIDNAPAKMTNVIAAPGDVLRVTHNLTTYAVLSLFGYGIGVFDVNGIESNEVPGLSPSGIAKAKEQLVLRANAEDTPSPAGGDLAFSPESHILGNGSESVKVYTLDARKGVVEFVVTPPDRISLNGRLTLTGGANPRFDALRQALVDSGIADPVARFNTGALYHNADSGKDYLLLAALDYGLVAVEVGEVPLTADSFADAVRIKDAAWAVRVIDDTNLAAVVDGTGRVSLVDLSRIDERSMTTGANSLFPTIANALAANTQDPRILWKSEQPIAIGTIAPVVDPDTGILIGADLLGRRVRLASVLDPKLRVVNSSAKEVSSIVPLGIPQPSGITASLGAFRVEAKLPGSTALAITIESERVAGIAMPQTREPYPVAHLRQTGARPTSDVALHRVLDFANAPELRYQKGWNRFASDWIVALADPRASKNYAWSAGTTAQQKALAGCDRCERPAQLQNDPTVRELYSTGRFLAIRPEPVDGSYAFLGQQGRLEARVTTIPADTIREPNVRVAAQAPPVAGGLLQETTYLHSGELETSAVDLDAGGRAGWNVAIDRTYRSRTLYPSLLGEGWDSSMFRRLRALPTGDVEYRDGAEVWTFKLEGGAYTSPAGLFLKLTRNDGGWSLVDQAQRLTTFDDYGRLTSESDEFLDPRKPDSGNTIRYLYRGDGTLATIVDPVGRATSIEFNATTGELDHITDWRGRTVTYVHDAEGRLTRVRLPDVATMRPELAYDYKQDAVATYNDRIELATDLITINDPGEATPRVAFTYAANGADRDRVTAQEWGSGEHASIAYQPLAVFDVLGQERRYTLTADRAHVAEVREIAVPVWNGAAFGKLPLTLSGGTASTAPVDRVSTFTYENGVLKSSKLEGVGETSVVLEQATAVGQRVKSTITTPDSAPADFVPPSLPITRRYEYQSGANFIEGVTAGGKRIESVEPHRGNTAPKTKNSDIESTRTFDPHGLLTDSESHGGTDDVSKGAKAKIEYFSESAAPHLRGLPHIIREGEGADELVTTYEYPSSTQTVSTDARGVITTTDMDAWQRPVHVSVTRPGDALFLEQTWRYDEAGRLVETAERKGEGFVTTRFSYDVVGRRLSTMTDGIATVGSMTTSTSYSLGTHTITTTHPGGAITTTELDQLGRTKRSVTITGSSPIEQQFAYDLAGNQVYATDMLVATATAFDAHGRAVASRAADGTISTTRYDEWSRPIEDKALTSNATTTIASTSYNFTDAGRATSITTQVDSGVNRTTSFGWDGGGRTTRTATNGRASAAAFDIAGRMKTFASGAGNLSALTEIFEKSEVKAHSGDLPIGTETSEKNGPAIAASMDRNTAGDVVRENLGPLEWKRTYDELGNVTSANAPKRPETSWQVDARGAVELETLPGGAKNEFAYHANGAQSAYTDPDHEPTTTQTDLLGRPLIRKYKDETTELTEWDGSRMKSFTDRQGRKQSYTYNGKGQLAEVRGGTNTLLDQYTYDDAGRLISWKTPDSELLWSDFNLEGAPKKTTQRRFRDGALLDEYVQTHAWNEHGERTQFSMPAPLGSGLPAGWTTSVQQSYDAMGNLIAITRGTPLMSAQYRNSGRPESRTVTTASGATIERTYSYDPSTSQLKRLAVAANGVLVAGSDVTYDGVQLSSAQMLGVSGQRFTRWRYDERSRLAATIAGTSSEPIGNTPGQVVEELTPADFRTAQTRTSPVQFDPRPEGGHKIATVTKGSTVTPFDWNGSERIDDGRFTYEFDTKGRLIRATEKALGGVRHRILYTYSGPGRLIGRRLESTTGSDWHLEEPETTYVWDPITDNLLAVFQTGAGPLKQVIHSGAAYDDPIETTTIDPQTGSITHLYPVYDEAAAGSLQLLLDEHAKVLARILPNDPYGAEDLDFTGPVIDNVTINITKNAAGAIASVEVRMHATERLEPSTVATGSRLAAVDASGAILLSPSVPATLAADDPFALGWTLTPAQWTTLTTTAGAADLSVAATNTLRAIAWSESAATLPVAVRHPLSTLTTFATTIPANQTKTSTIYTIENLTLAGTAGGADQFIENALSARFQALPFEERVTGLVYVRNRWFDPGTGTWLSPDPMGYVDSSNLYAFCGSDPVNRRDPTGEDAYDDKLQGYIHWYSDQQGSMDQEYKRLQEAYKRAVATNNDVGVIVADINIIERQRMMFGGSVEGAATFIEYARSKGDATVLRMSYEGIYAAVVGDEAVRGVGAAVVGAFMPHAPVARQALRRGSSRVASAYRNSIVSSETGTVAPQVTNKSKAARLRDARGRFSTDPENPPSPYVYTDAQRRAAWKKLAEDPTSPLTPMQRQQVRERGWRGPQQVNPRTGELETMELSHEPTPLREGGTEVVPRWPEEHAAVDPHRHLKKRQ